MNKRVTHILKKCDMHGHPVALTYKSNQNYQTSIGGFVTILSRLGIFAYFLVLVLKIVDREKKVTFKNNYMSANKDSQVYPLNTDNFDLAFSFQFSDGKLHTEEKNNIQKYMKFEFSHTDSTWNLTSAGTKIVSRKQTIIGDTDCTHERFAKLNDSINDLGIANGGWHCVKDLGFDLKGQFSSFTRTLLKLRIVPCTNSSTIDSVTCATPEEVEALIKVTIINVSVLTAYFQQDEFDGSPIKKDINNFIYNIKSTQGFTQVMNIKKHILNTKDYWLSSFINNGEYEFYQVNEQKIMVGDIKSNSFDMFTMLFYCAQEEVVIERTVLTFTDILATAGGFSSIIILLTRIVSRQYSKLLFENKLIKKLYKVQCYSNQDKLFNHNYQTRDLENIHLDNEAGGEKNNKLLNQLWVTLTQRHVPKFSLLVIFFNHLFFCFSHRVKDQTRNQLLFRKGQQLIHKQFDIVHILKQIRKMKIVTELVMKDYQYAMLKYTSRNLISMTNQTSKKSIDFLKKGTLPHGKDYNLLKKLLMRDSELNRRIVDDLKSSMVEGGTSQNEISKIFQLDKDDTVIYGAAQESSKVKILQYDEDQFFHNNESSMQTPHRPERTQAHSKRSVQSKRTTTTAKLPTDLSESSRPRKKIKAKAQRSSNL